MRLVSIRHLRGPNVFGASPVTVARLELDELTSRETTEFAGFGSQLLALFPGLADHYCAAGQPGGFLVAMERGTYFGHVSEHVALELSGLAGRAVHLGRTMWAGADGRYDVMTECPADEPAESAVPRALLDLAMAVVADVLAGRPASFDAELDRIAGLVEREQLGVSTAAIASAARRRGIPVRRVNGLSLLRLGYGCHRRLVWASLTSQTSAPGVDIAANKQLAKQLLDDAGVPVPPGRAVRSEQEAAGALAELGAPIVVKPLGGSHGARMTIGVRSAAEAAAAYRKAAGQPPEAGQPAEAGQPGRAGEPGAPVLAEALVPGNDYRVLVIDGKIAAAAQLRPAAVTGDGVATIAQLVAAANADPRRGPGHARELTTITLDSDALAHLDSLGLDEHSVPADGQAVTLRRNANLSTGGTSKDVTDTLHPQVADMCRRAAGVAGLDVCGIDLRLADISAPLHDLAGHGLAQPCAVLELNACPGLRMHLSPTEGRPRDVAATVVDSLYPPGIPARIPIVSVTGTNGKTTTVRMISKILSQAGLKVGLSCTDGVYIGGRLAYAADASGPRSAQMVLDDPAVEAAVLESARGGIVRRGLGYDLADVAVLTNISADHLGDDCIDDLDELIHVKALVAEQIRDGGCVVLNADDPATAALADRRAVRARDPVVRLFSVTPGSAAHGSVTPGSVTPGSAALERHRAAGGLCYEVVDGQLTETEAGERRPLLALTDLPASFGGRARHQVANALAAAAACRALGVSVKDIARALTVFIPAEENPGRANAYLAGESTILLDYGHNAAALEATGRFVHEVFGGEPVAAVTLPGDRRDDLITATAEAIAASFGTVVLYEDSDKRGRAPGEMLALVSSALQAARPGIRLEQAPSPAEALRTAVDLAGAETVLFVYEKLGQAREALAAVGARPLAPSAVRPHGPQAVPGSPASAPGTLGPVPAADPGPAPGAPGSPSPAEPGAPTVAPGIIADATAVVAGAALAAQEAVDDAAAVVARAAAADRANRDVPRSRDGSADYADRRTEPRD